MTDETKDQGEQVELTAQLEPATTVSAEELQALMNQVPDDDGAASASQVVLVPTTPKAKQLLESNEYDEVIWQRAQDEMPDLFKEVQAAKDRNQFGEELARDLFNALYYIEPIEQGTSKEYGMTAEAVRQAMTTAEYQEWHAYTQVDAFNSALSATTFVEEVSKALEEEEKKAKEAQENGEGEGDGEGQGFGPGFGLAMRNAARAAAQKAKEEMESVTAVNDAFSGEQDRVGPGWGQGGQGSVKTGDMRKRMELTRKLQSQPRLRNIAKKLGRMKIIAEDAQRKRTEHAADEIVDVTQGNDLADVLSSELLYARHPKLRRLFQRDLLTASLLQYKLSANEKVGKGPIVVCIDGSGSMMGEPIDWAMAIFLTLLSIAAKQKRDVRVIEFGSSSQIRVQDFKKGKATQQEVLDTVLHFFMGGTDYEIWMKASLEAIETSEYKQADVILLSDGICGIRDQMLQTWTAARKEKQFRCQSILIGGYDYGNTRQFLESFSDDVTMIQDLRDDRAVLEQTFSI